MKKAISLLLILSLLAALAACGGSGSENPPATEVPTLQVGYAKENITPTTPVDLWGYAQMPGERMSNGFMDYIYLTCVAITDSDNNTLLMFGADLGDMGADVTAVLREAISKETGIPGDHMFFSATHTHSAPDCRKIKDSLKKAAVKIAIEALEDRKAAEMFFGTAETAAISFVRHYYEKNGAVVTDNHGNTTNPDLDRHTTEIDREMRVVQFKREGAQDVLLVNWQSHPHMTGGTQKYSISADIVGAMRMELEKDDYLMCYYQGGAGNINPTSRFKEEMVNPDYDYKVHGQYLAKAAKEALTNTTQVNAGPIRVTTETFSCEANKEDLDLEDEAQQVVNYYKEGHTATECKPLAESLGLYSYYHAYHLLSRKARDPYFDVEIATITIGEFAWCLTPGEFFDTTMKHIRDNSPFPYNFTVAYTNDYHGYFPSLDAWEYGCYETDTAQVAPGVAEGIAERLLEMLAEHKK